MEKNPQIPDYGELSLPDPEDSKIFESQKNPDPIPEKVLSPDEIALEGMMMSPEAAMAHAVESVDEPIEGLREQRVEKKGDTSSNQPVPVGSVIAGMPQPRRQDPATMAPPPVEPPVLTAIPPTYDEEERLAAKPSMYKRAIISGFYFALVLIIFYGLAKLLF